MLIRYIELENFLGHESEKLTLPEEGLFLLSGESGAGKSSLIVDAIGYALFGAVATRAKKQSELAHRDHPGEAMVVRVMFELEGSPPLIVARGIDERGGSWAKVYEPDPDDPSSSTLLAEGAQPVARYLRRRIGGMSWRQFYAAFVARQSEISLLTELSGRERKEKIHQMLGMRELEKTEELIAAGLRRARAEVEQLERSLGGVGISELRARRAEAKRELGERTERLEQSRAEESQAAAEVKRAETELAPLRAAREQAERRAELEGRLAVARQAAERHRAAEAVAERLPALRRAVEEASAERERLSELYKRSRDHARAAERLAELEEIRNEARAKLLSLMPVAVGAGEQQAEGADAADISPRELRDEEQRLISSLDASRKRLAELDEQQARLAERGECYACLRPFESEAEHDHALNELRQRREEVAAEIERMEERAGLLRSARPQIDSLERTESEIEAARRRLAEVDAEGEVCEDLEGLVARGKEAAEKAKQTSRELAAAEAEHQGLDPKALEQLERLEAELKSIGAAAHDPEATRAAEERLTAAERRLAALRGQLPELERAVADAERALEAADRELSGYENELEHLERLRSTQLAHERLQSLVRAYKLRLAEEIRPALEEIGSEMLQRISGGRHRALRIADENYEIEVETAEGFVLPAAMLSGGEEIRANICLRLALTRLVSQRTGVPVGFLVLDEPLPAQDPGHVERILELLQSLRPFYRQQFIISHVGDLRHADAIDHIIDFKPQRGAGRVELIAA